MVCSSLPPALCLLAAPEWEATKWLVVASICVFAFGYRLGLGGLFALYSSEIYSPEIRGTAAGLSVLFAWGSGFTAGVSWFSLPNEVLFPICAGVNIFALIFIFIFVKETKGRSMQNSPYFVDRPNSFVPGQCVEGITPAVKVLSD